MLSSETRAPYNRILKERLVISLSPKASTHVNNPTVRRRSKTINGRKVQSFGPAKPIATAPTPHEEKPVKPHVNIGVIGHVDHSKNTLTAAIELVLKHGVVDTFATGLEITPGEILSPFAIYDEAEEYLKGGEDK